MAPARHWPDRPGLIGGRDELAGGTWLAVDPAAPRAACVLNGVGPGAPEERRRSRGELLDGDGLDPSDDRALIVRRELDGGRGAPARSR